MDFSQESILNFFSQYAYDANMVYILVVLFFFASSLGFPLPEEVILISLGLVCFVARHPDIYPPDINGPNSPVNAYTAAGVSLLAVIGSDLVIFYLGRWFGSRFINSKLSERWKLESVTQRLQKWMDKYGALACGVFRFTPGLRFPGHMSCGFLGVPLWKFITVDGLAALLTVPTQILVIAFYGEHILDYMRRFKVFFFALLFVVVLLIIYSKRKAHTKKIERASS